MIQYAAFLRGINVGGNVLIKMEDLRKTLESIKLKNVKTILASGNVVFEATETNPETLTKTIEQKLAKTFGRHIGVILRTMDEIIALIDANPFKIINVTNDTRLYITFLKEKPSKNAGLKIPYESPQKNFRILEMTNNSLVSVLTLLPNIGTVDAMNIIEKTYGKKVTTRNWNTIVKISKNK